MVESRGGSIHTTHGVTFTEEFAATKEWKTDAMHVLKTKHRRSMEAKETNLLSPNIDLHKSPPSLENKESLYDYTYVIMKFRNVVLHVSDFRGMQALFAVISKPVSNSGFPLPG